MICCEAIAEVTTSAAPTRLRLECPVCGFTAEDDGFRMECGQPHAPALLASRYENQVFHPALDEAGLYRYRGWLPVHRTLTGSGRTVTYWSESLSQLTGLRNLWIAFNGYWPEIGAHLATGTFKDLEAYSVLARMPFQPQLDQYPILVVASAGNTAAAFARACSLNDIRCLIVMPESGIQQMRFDIPISSCVKVLSLAGGSDYSDAIQLAERVARLPGFIPEGGAKNVARRDGLGTVMLNAFEAIGRLPDYYFQAIGSGTGAIAAHEAARRLTGGRGPFPRLWLSQNAPFVPICNRWESRSRTWSALDENQAKRQIGFIKAKVLSNRRPPYAVTGGLFDALVGSDGEVVAVTNEQSSIAAKLFEASENIDIDPAGAVAFASLLDAVSNGSIPTGATVVLNITGGGRRRLTMDTTLTQKSPDLSIEITGGCDEGKLKHIAGLFG
jgi:cysteate synthase